MVFSQSRKNPFRLFVALQLNNLPYAYGELYWDDGESLGNSKFATKSPADASFFSFFFEDSDTTNTFNIIRFFATEASLRDLRQFGSFVKKKKKFLFSEHG
jgi:hypothetical protein